MKSADFLKLIKPALTIDEYKARVLTQDLANSDYVYYVVEGLVLQEYVNRPSNSGRGIALPKTPGDFSGIRFVFPENDRQTKVMLHVPRKATIGHIKHADLLRLIDYPYSGTACFLFEQVFKEDDDMAKLLEVVALFSPPDAILEILRDLKPKIGVEHAQGCVIPITNPILAMLWGGAEESTRRAVNHLMKDGKLVKVKQHFLLFDD